MTKDEALIRLKHAIEDIHDIAEMRADCDVTPDGHNQPNDCMQIQILTETAKALLGRFA